MVVCLLSRCCRLRSAPTLAFASSLCAHPHPDLPPSRRKEKELGLRQSKSLTASRGRPRYAIALPREGPGEERVVEGARRLGHGKAPWTSAKQLEAAKGSVIEARADAGLES